jgi:DNA-binding NarL/FixJ family response regulator
MLATIEGFEVVAEAADGESTVREAVLTVPDIVLMDVRMPGMGGVEATRRLRAAVPSAAVLMLTMYDDDATVLTAMQAGARGYLLKGADQREIVAAIWAVLAGQVIFGPGVAAHVLDYFNDTPQAAPPQPYPQLTEREREILELLATGLRTAAIAERLHLSSKTVSNQLTSVFGKLEVSDRAQAIIRARDAGFGRTP